MFIFGPSNVSNAAIAFALLWVYLLNRIILILMFIALYMSLYPIRTIFTKVTF